MVKYFQIIWFTLLYGWISLYISRIAITPSLPSIMEELNLTYAEGGLLASAFFFAYTFMQPLGGYLGDKLGRRIILGFGSLLWTLSTFFISLSNSFLQIFVLRFLTGIGQGTYFSNEKALISYYTPKDKLGFGLGISFTGLGLGFGISVILGGFLIELFGWRNLFLIYSLPSFIAMFLLFTLIKDPPKNLNNNIKVEKILLIKNRNLWILYLAGIPPVYIQWVIGTWAPSMFLELGEKDIGLASAYSSVFGFSAFGLALSGSLSDKMVKRGKERKYISIIYMVILFSLLLFLSFILANKYSPWILTVTLFFIGFFMWGCWSPLFAYQAELVPEELRGLSFGLLNAFNFLGSIIAPWLTGLIKDYTGSFIYGIELSAFLLLISIILILKLEKLT